MATRAWARSRSRSTGTARVSRRRAAVAARASCACTRSPLAVRRASSSPMPTHPTAGWASSITAPRGTSSCRMRAGRSRRRAGLATAPRRFLRSRRSTAAPAPASSLARITTWTSFASGDGSWRPRVRCLPTRARGRVRRRALCTSRATICPGSPTRPTFPSPIRAASGASRIWSASRTGCTQAFRTTTGARPTTTCSSLRHEMRRPSATPSTGQRDGALYVVSED